MAINTALIKLAREHAHKTQDVIALEVGSTKTYISLLENGKRSPSVQFAKRLAKALNLNWQDIFKE